MTSTTPDSQIEGLRERVRQAGESVLAVRITTAALVAAPCLLFALIASLIHDPSEEAAWGGRPAVVPPWLVWLGVAFVLGALVGLMAAALFRRLQRARVRRTLATFSREQQAETLTPLLAHPSGDIRKMVAPLFRELALPTELAPVAAPDGRGDEPASPEQPW